MRVTHGCSCLRSALSALVCLSAVFVRAEPNSVREIDAVRANLSRSLEFLDQAAGEQFAWDSRRGQLENLVFVAEEEKKSLEEAIRVARPMLEDLHSQLLGLASDREESKVLADYLRVAGPRLAAKLLEKSRRWPDPLLSATNEQFHTIRSILDPEVAIISDGDLAALLQSAVEAVEEALKFQSRITHALILRDLPDGREALFETFYLGLGGGFYRSEELNLAGRIVMRGDGWTWIPQADLFEPIGLFLEILKGEQPAAWIDLPIEVGSEKIAP